MTFFTDNKLNKPHEIDTKYPESNDRHTKKHPHIENNDKSVPKEFNTNKGYQNNLNLNDMRFRNRNTDSAGSKLIPASYSNQPANDRLIPNNDYLEKPLTEFRKLYTDIRSRSVDRSKSSAVDRTTKSAKSSRNSRSPPRKPSYETIEQTETSLPSEVLELQVKKEALIKEKEEKKVELEILKDNINKMYNLETRKSLSAQPMSEMSDSEDRGNNKTTKGKSEHNAEGEYEGNKVMESRPISVDGRDSENTSDVPPDAEGGGEQISPKMTIIISPKRSPTDLRPAEKRRSVSPEQAARLTRNDVLDAIFHTDRLKETSSYDMEVESKDEQETLTDEEQDTPEDYPDDFSADVDNYATSDYGNSPISLAKPIDDENFWDS